MVKKSIPKTRWSSNDYRVFHAQEIFVEKDTMKFNFLSLVCMLLMGACDRQATELVTDPTISGRVTSHGLYQVVRTGPLVDNAKTNTGKTHSASTIQLIEKTDRIPIKKGNYFGFQSRIEPLPGKSFIKLRKVVIHPPMVLPDGSSKTGYQLDETKKVSSGVAFTTSGYSLDEDYELVAGEWVFQYWLEGQLLIEQKFFTYEQPN
jgi:hypothetical protein